MRQSLQCTASILLVGALTLAAGAQTITTTPTFHNMGVEVAFATAPPAGTTVSMAVRKQDDPGTYRPVHDLSRISGTEFAGSVLELESGTTYSIRLHSTAFGSDQVVTASTREDSFGDAFSVEYHVAPGGDDTHEGSSFEDAFATLGHALSVAAAGSTILLHESRYLEGDLNLPRSGSAALPIVIRNAPGAAPILDGTDPDFAPNWSVYDAVNHVYRTSCTALPTCAYLDGEHLFHYLSLDDLRENRWAQPGGYTVDGTHMYARFPEDAPPGGHVVMIPRYTTGLTIDHRSHIQVRGIEFCYFGYGTYHRGIYINGGDDNLVDRCRFHHNGVGVALKRAADFNTVQHCTFNESPITTWAWAAVKEGGVGYEAGGVVVYASSTPNSGNVIRYNRFTDMFDGSNLYSSDRDGPTKNMDFHHNTISGCGDDAVETDGAGSNNRIYRNAFHDFLTGVSVAPCAIGPTYIFRNVLSAWHSVDGYEGYPFKFNVSSSLPIERVYLYHNTCHTEATDQNGFLFKQYSNWSDVVSRNNIYAGTSYALESWAGTNPVDFDHDNLYTTHGTRFIRWDRADYGTVEAFAAATGQEPHGMALAPGFTDAAQGDYQLRPTSLLIDRGVAIPGVNDGYAGAAPDVGAFEFRPRADSIAVSGSGVTMEWTGQTGLVYQLRYTPEVVQGTWADLGAPATTTNGLLSVIDPAPAGPQRFYRLREAD